jgi:outer membrane protein assembly factor BamB
MKKIILMIFTVQVAIAIISFHTLAEGNDCKITTYGKGWPTAHGDPANTDYSTVSGPRNIKLAWHHKFKGTINLGPVIDETGRVYVTSTSDKCHLYALNSRTGKVIWCTDKVNEFAVASSALLDNEGHIFVADNEAMHAFDSSGKLLWEQSITGFPFSAQFTKSGYLLFITHIGRIYVLDRKTGKNIIAPTDLISDILSIPEFDTRSCMRGTSNCPSANTIALDQCTGNFYFTFWAPGAERAGLRAMRFTEFPKPSMTTLWVNDFMKGGSASSPDLSINGKRVYVNDNSGILYALDSRTGNIVWRFDIGYEPGGSQSTSPEGLILPAGGNNVGQICIQDNGTNGKLLWKNDELQNRGISTQASGNLAYVTVKTTGFENDIVVVETDSGTVIDREHLSGKTIFTVGTTVGPDGYIYVPSINGHLFVYRPED